MRLVQMLALVAAALVTGVVPAQPDSPIAGPLAALGPGTVLITGGNRGLGLEFAR